MKKLAKSESVSSEEDIDTEAKVMEEVKRKSLAEHQAMASQMDKENKEMEMAIAKSLVDQQRLQSEKKTQEDILEHQMKKLSMNEPTTSSAAGKIITLNTFNNLQFFIDKEGACGNLMSKKFKKRFLIPCESHSSSEEKDDGLFTATDVIKEEVKKLENRLSDQDLLDIKRKTMAKEDVKNWQDNQSKQQKQLIESSEPLTKSIMNMRAMPVSKLLSQRGYQDSPRSSTSSSVDLKEILKEAREEQTRETQDYHNAHQIDLKDSIILFEPTEPETENLKLDDLQEPDQAEQKDNIEEQKETSKDTLAELKDPKVMETKALKLFKQLSVELMNENPWIGEGHDRPLIKGFSVCP